MLPLGEGEGHAEGVARHADFVADEGLLCGEGQLGQRREVPLGGQQRNVAGRVGQHDVGPPRAAVVVLQGDRVEPLDDVVVGHEEVVALQVEAASRTAGMVDLQHGGIERIAVSHRSVCLGSGRSVAPAASGASVPWMRCFM